MDKTERAWTKRQKMGDNWKIFEREKLYCVKNKGHFTIYLIS